MADYKIDLGISLNTQDLNKIKNDIKSLEDKPIRLEIDAETKELTKSIQDALKTLSNGSKNVLTLDTSKFEGSIADIKSAVVDLKKVLGTLDDSTNMKSLLAYVNQIANAIGKVTDESETLVKSLNALSKKDFGFNFNLKTGGVNPTKLMTDYGQAASRKSIPAIKEQINYLKDLINKTTDADRALNNYLFKQNRGYAGITLKQSLEKQLSSGYDSEGNKVSKSDRMLAGEELVGYYKEIAALNNISLDGFNAKFAKSATEIVDDTTKIQTGVKQTEEAIESAANEMKQLFNMGVGADQLSAQLEPIVSDLNQIREAVQNLSSVMSLDGLTDSFDRLSKAIEDLLTNAEKVRGVLGDNLGATVDGGNTEKVIQDQKELAKQAQETANAVVQSGEKIEQSYREIEDAVEQVSKIKIGNTELDALNLKNDIDGVDKLSAALSKLKSIQGSIDEIEIGEIDISKGVQEIQTLEKQLESLSNEYDETVAKINGMGGVSATQFQSFQNDIDSTNRKIEQLQSNLREKIQTAIGTNVARDVAKAHSECDKLSDKSDELRQKLQQLDDIQIELELEKEHGDVQKLSELYTRYLNVLKDVNAQLDIQKRAQRDAASQQKLDDDIILFQTKIDSWLTKNSAAAKQFGSKMLDLQARAEGCDRTTLNHLEAEFKQVDRAAEAAGKKTQTVGDSLKAQFSKYSTYFGVAELFMWVEQGLRDMFEQVKLIDSAMTELKKVTDETDASYNRFLTNAASRAQEIGTTIDGLVSSTADFARLGYGFEDAQGLAEVANIYAVVGDEIDGVEGATESLISTMAAFKDQMNGMSNDDFAMSIIDVYNEIGNNFAISSGGLGEALERSASSLAAANNTLHESASLITAANTVVQNPEKVGKIVVPTIKMAISVKSWRQSRPRKDFISILIYIN